MQCVPLHAITKQQLIFSYENIGQRDRYCNKYRGTTIRVLGQQSILPINKHTQTYRDGDRLLHNVGGQNKEYSMYPHTYKWYLHTTALSNKQQPWEPCLLTRLYFASISPQLSTKVAILTHQKGIFPNLRGNIWFRTKVVTMTARP